MNDIRTALVEINRELTVRRSVYPKLIAAGKLTHDEAERRIQALHHAAEMLADCANHHVINRSTMGKVTT
jgi:hypothetical protein